ncbi:protein of unknown function [Streptantibioticus cattleyicolor NRRL 8057 = DSM 46488]|nr:protein of unknown function [Streptantibioticus cattleyicolor NRRL 8057 = DSM 46488]
MVMVCASPSGERGEHLDGAARDELDGLVVPAAHRGAVDQERGAAQYAGELPRSAWRWRAAASASAKVAAWYGSSATPAAAFAAAQYRIVPAGTALAASPATMAAPPGRAGLLVRPGRSSYVVPALPRP